MSVKTKKRALPEMKQVDRLITNVVDTAVEGGNEPACRLAEKIHTQIKESGLKLSDRQVVAVEKGIARVVVEVRNAHKNGKDPRRESNFQDAVKELRNLLK